MAPRYDFKNGRAYVGHPAVLTTKEADRELRAVCLQIEQGLEYVCGVEVSWEVEGKRAQFFDGKNPIPSLDGEGLQQLFEAYVTRGRKRRVAVIPSNDTAMGYLRQLAE